MATLLNQKAETTRQLVHLMFDLRDQLRQFMQKRFRENNIDLTYEMHQIMAALWRKDGINQQELADITLKDKASMTFLIDNLTKRGLVTRSEHPADRRSKLIYLTASGRKLGKKVEPWVAELFSVMSRDFQIKDVQEAMALLEKMRDNIIHSMA
ncbi:MAG TPA: MarR family transcriptional regulator [Chitinophagaceae bacterium]|nr:MarR family transcriptional regulator [Chitinophagaceae bacterium]